MLTIGTANRFAQLIKVQRFNNCLTIPSTSWPNIVWVSAGDRCEVLYSVSAWPTRNCEQSRRAR